MEHDNVGQLHQVKVPGCSVSTKITIQGFVLPAINAAEKCT